MLEMIRALPTPLYLRLHWHWWAIAAILVMPNAMMLAESVWLMVYITYPVFDWWLLGQAVERIGTRTMYDWTGPLEHGYEYSYRYSPLLPYLYAPLVPLGLGVFRALHFVALLGLPRRIIPLALLSGPFWFDVAYTSAFPSRESK